MTVASPPDCLLLPLSASHVLMTLKDMWMASHWLLLFSLLLTPKTMMTTSPECSFQTKRPELHALVQRTVEASGSRQEQGGSVGGRTFGMGTAIRASRPPTLARIPAASSNFSTSSTGVRRKEDKRKAKRWTAGRQAGTALPFPPSTFQEAAMLGNWTSHPQRDRPGSFLL